MKRLAALACRLVLGAIFLYAAATKVPDMAAFAKDLANYRLVPAALVPWAASAVVGVEIVAGLALVLGVGARAAALVAGALLLLFVGGLAQALLRGIDLRCGCFGSEESATWGTVLRDVVMLVPAVAVVWLGPGGLPRRTDAPPAKRTAPAAEGQKTLSG
ncbi:MAG: MauE/DoxX family redox-associated membrane protein [Anaeromyxobacteraceae bacterium]